MTDSFPAVFLIGPRGSGKTSVGRLLARKLGCELYDTDALVTSEAGRNVTEIVALEGWEGFRERESRALVSAAGPGRIVATGGGMILSEANRRFMRGQGLVIYLAAPAEALYARLVHGHESGQRPALTDKDLLQEITEVLAERGHLYRRTAHHSVDAAVSAPEVLGAIIRILGRNTGKTL